MPKERSPAFQFYPADWLSDTRTMSATARGGYITLLAECWRAKTLSNEDLELFALAGMTQEEWREHGAAVRARFRLFHKRLRHKRLDKERAIQDDYRQKQQAAGRRGATQRWGRHGNPNGVGMATPGVSAIGSHGSSSVSVSVSVPVRTRTGADAPTAPESETQNSFSEFWSLYPRKVAKAKARKAWFALNPDVGLRATILAAVAQHAKMPQWVKDGGQFIPHPATWLHQRRWEDELGVRAEARASLHWYDDCHHEPRCERRPDHTLRLAKEALKGGCDD